MSMQTTYGSNPIHSLAASSSPPGRSQAHVRQSCVELHAASPCALVTGQAKRG